MDDNIRLIAVLDRIRAADLVEIDRYVVFEINALAIVAGGYLVGVDRRIARKGTAGDMQFNAFGTVNLRKLLQVLKPIRIGFRWITHIYLTDAAVLNVDQHVAIEGLLVIAVAAGI